MCIRDRVTGVRSLSTGLRGRLRNPSWGWTRWLQHGLWVAIYGNATEPGCRSTTTKRWFARYRMRLLWKNSVFGNIYLLNCDHICVMVVGCVHVCVCLLGWLDDVELVRDVIGDRFSHCLLRRFTIHATWQCALWSRRWNRVCCTSLYCLLNLPFASAFASLDAAQFIIIILKNNSIKFWFVVTSPL